MKKRLALALALCFAGAGAFAQNEPRVIPGNAGMYPAYVVFPEGIRPNFVPGAVLLQQNDGFISSNATILVNKEQDQIGEEHFRYQQTIRDIPVENAVYIMHVSGGKVKSMNGEWIASEPTALSSVPAVNETKALQLAMTAFGAKVYKWQLPAEEAFIKAERGDPKASFFPKGQLTWYSGEQEVSAEKLRLAWKLDIYAQDPVSRRIYFVDAQTGQVLGKRDLIHNTNAAGTAVTGYSGTQGITTDQTSTSNYRLRETGRGNGINTYNLRKGTSYGSAVDFTDADNYWNNVNANLDQYATDAHWGAEKTYDYYKNTYNRNSIDNAGFAINSYVHYSSNYFNAFWDGSRMTYGDGSSVDNNKPLTAIDVCGHEITHGLTSYTANLTYSYESGALNEGFSDVFGTTIEFYANPSTANWLIGEAFYTIRSMSNPNAYGDPDTYQGTNWATGSADNGGVHTNSGVLNFWYYLLTTGGSGTNDKSFSYSVSGIGLTKAAAIAYRTLTVYLTATSNYASARTASVMAATDLYGASSNEVTQVKNAWDAVGVGTTTTPPPCTDNYESNETRTAAKAIPVNTDITARISSTSDKDWFSFATTSTAPKLKVTLTNLPKDYDIRLYNASGTQLGISQYGGTTSESITYNASSSAATYYVQVYGYNGANSTSCYLLRAGTGSVNQLEDDAIMDDAHLMKNNSSGFAGEMMVSPNPAHDKLTLSFSDEESRATTLSITDLTGRVIFEEQLTSKAGMNTINLPLVNYVPGMYFLHVSGKGAMKFQVSE